ncbi:MAG: hypothetical protein OEV15_07910, partial [Gallionella sp.]|nr:hypothetical protein [Gallionella sp.]
DTQRVVSVMKALDENFSDYAIYASDIGDILIIATQQGALPEIPATLPDMPQLRADMKRVDVITPHDLAIRKLGGKKLFAPWLAKSNTPANSDYQPYLDQHASRDRFMGASGTDLLRLTMEPLPIVEMLGTPLPWVKTSVTASPHWLQRPHPSFNAMLVRDLLQARPLVRPANIPETDWRNAVAKATRVIEECRAPPEGNAVYGLLNFAFEALPYLRPAENAQLMRSIGGYACVTKLGGQERAWLELLDAVGQRNGHGMVESVNALVAAGLGNTPARKRYLLATGMLGNLSLNRTADALSLWQALAPQVYGNSAPLLTMQIMAAWSETKRGGGAQGTAKNN